MPSKKETSTKKTAAASVKKPTSKAATKASTSKSTKKTSKPSETQLSNTSSENGLKKTFAKDGKMRNLKFDKRVAIPVLGIIIVLILGYLANRYLVVAWVDNKPITRMDYYNELSKRYGKDEMEQLVVQKLIESEAEKKGVSASDADIKTQITQIETQQGGASQLDQVLQMQNLTRADLNNLVRLQILRQKLFGAGIIITDADVNNYIQQNQASLPPVKEGDASGAAQLRDSVRQQLMQEKVSATFSAWLQQNENSNRVVRIAQ